MFLPTKSKYWSVLQGRPQLLDGTIELQTVGNVDLTTAALSQTIQAHPVNQPSHLQAHGSAFCLIKRSVDILGALVGLAIVSFLFIPIAIAIKLDSPGPIFYAQTRHGLQGQPFKIWKFRSMVRSADALKHRVENKAQGLIFKNENDPRITRVGQFLRKTSLDEFPQFWNVLRGDMSLVGTRPPTTDEVAQYAPHHWQRLAVKPGITGQWQVNGRSQIKDFEEIVKLDLEYQQRWSWSYDIQIVLKTLQVLLNRQGAY